MKNLLAKSHFSQADSQKSSEKPCGSFVELKAGEVEGQVQHKESHSSKSESSSSPASLNQNKGHNGSEAENFPQPPQYEISQKAYLVNEQENLHHRPSLAATQLRHARRQDSQYKNFHQHQTTTTPQPFLDRIPQWVKFSALLLGSMSIAAIILKYPLPSSDQQQPSVTTTSPSLNSKPSVESPSPLPQNELPLSVTPSAQLPLLQEVPLPTPPNPSSLPESQNQIVSVNPSPAPIPSPTSAQKLSSPAPVGSVPVVPPSLPSMPPLTPSPPCPCPFKAAGTAAQDTRLNNNSQLAEVRNYLQQRWNPPSGLTQTLEYRLLLNRDGSIERISPVGQAAVEYIDRTNIPLPGERFVSALQGEANAKIRVILTPKGKVQTTLER